MILYINIHHNNSNLINDIKIKKSTKTFKVNTQLCRRCIVSTYIVLQNTKKIQKPTQNFKRVWLHSLRLTVYSLCVFEKRLRNYSQTGCNCAVCHKTAGIIELSVIGYRSTQFSKVMHRTYSMNRWHQYLSFFVIFKTIGCFFIFGEFFFYFAQDCMYYRTFGNRYPVDSILNNNNIIIIIR